MPIVVKVLLFIVGVPVVTLLFIVGLAIVLWIVMLWGSPVIALLEGNPRYMLEVLTLPVELFRKPERPPVEKEPKFYLPPPGF